MTSQPVALRNHAFQNGVLACMVIATRTVKALIHKAARSKWSLLLTIAAGALLAVVAMKLMALLGAAFDISFLRNSGSETGNGAGFGAGGAGLGGGAAGGAGGGDGGGGGGGGSSNGKDPWWKDWIPHTIPIVGGTGWNVFNGRFEGPGFSAGAAPGSDPAGPIVDVNLGVPGLGSHGPQGNVSVSVNQQNVPLTGAGSTTPTGRQILNANMSSDGTYNNIGN